MSAQEPAKPAVTIAGQTAAVTEGEDAVFTVTRSQPHGQSLTVRVAISGHDKVMSDETRKVNIAEVRFARAVASAELRVTTEQDNHNEGDGDIRARIVSSAEHPYTIGEPNEAVVRVRDDDIPRVTLHVLSPEGLTVADDTWVGEMPEGEKIQFETRCTGSYTYSHPFLAVLDHDHAFDHPYNDYNHAGYWSAPCNREREFPVSAGRSFTGPDGGQIRARLVSTVEIESRWQGGGRILHDAGSSFIYFTCLEQDHTYCPRYTLGTPAALQVAVYNLNPTVVIAAQRDEVEEGEAARFVITRIWDHPGIFELTLPGNPLADTRIGYRIAEAGGYVAAADTGERQHDAFTFLVHEYVLEVPTIDDTFHREGGAVTVELLPDSFPEVNIGGRYERYETLPGVTPPGASSIRATVSIRDNDPAVTVAMGGESVAVQEASGAVSIEVVLSGPAEREVTVDYSTRAPSASPDGGTGAEMAAAAADEDYTAGSGTLTFARGVTANSVAIAIIDDVMDEPAERFEVVLSNARQAAVGQPAVTSVTILPDDREVQPEAWIEARLPDPVSEGSGSIEFVVRLSAASGHVVQGTVRTPAGNDDSAVMDHDFRAIKGRTIQIPAGEMERIVPVELIDDDREEEVETFTIVLENVAHARVRAEPGGDSDRSEATGAIADDDGERPPPDRPSRIALRVRPGLVPESGASGALAVTAALVGGTEEWDTTVRVSVDPREPVDVALAVAPDDFTPVEPVDVIIPAGASSGSASFVFVPVNDALDEPDETVFFRGEVVRSLHDRDSDADRHPSIARRPELSEPESRSGPLWRTGLPVLPAWVILVDDDRRSVAVSPRTVTVDEGGRNASYAVVLRSQPFSAVTVAVEVPAEAANLVATPRRLRFNKANWNKAQTVSVRAGADDNGTDEEVVLSHVVSGADYQGERVPGVAVIVREPAAAGASVSERSGGDAPLPLPVLSVDDVRGVEGDDGLRFVVALSRAARQPVTVVYATVDGTAVAGEDYRADSGTLRFDAGDTRRTVAVALVDDETDEVDEEMFTLQLSEASGNAVFTGGGATLAAAGTIVDDDRPPALSVGDVRVAETQGRADFAMRLSTPSGRPVTVAYATRDGTATAGADYRRVAGVMTFAPGQTAHTVAVRIIDDARIEGDETFTFAVLDTVAARLTDAGATATIVDSEPLQNAWLARFGRTVGEHVVGAVQERLTAPRDPGLRGRIAGHQMFSRASHALADRADHAYTPNPVRRRSPTVGEVLAGSEFTLATGIAHSGTERERRDGAGGTAAWGRGAASRFGGRDGVVVLDGDVWSAMLGIDRASGPLVVGVALAHTRGAGGYRGAGAGDLTAAVTGLYPYLGYRPTDRALLWSAGGYGVGAARLAPEGGSALHTDVSLVLGAAGMRASLAAPAPPGLSLDLAADAFLVRTMSGAAGDASGRVPAAHADVARLRLGLEGAYLFIPARGVSLTPSLELALRRDEGDAETGFGIDVGAGLGWADSGSGLSADVRARGVVVHQASGLRDWQVSGRLSYDPSPASALGPSLAVAASAGWRNGSLAEGAPAGTNAVEDGRVDAELGYGFPVLDRRLTGTPHFGLRQTAEAREYRLGFDLSPAARDRAAWTLGVEARRRESAVSRTGSEHELWLGASATW